MATAIILGIALALLLASAAAGWAAQRRSDAARRWPSVEGRIVGVAFEERGNGTYAPQVSYAYSVAGRGFASDRLRPGGTPFFYSAKKAVAATERYQDGAPVIVHHHPAKPARAAIELEPFSYWVWPLRVMAAVAAGLALIVAVAI